MSNQFGFYDPDNLRAKDKGVTIDFINAKTGERTETTAYDVDAIALINAQIQNQIDHGVCSSGGEIESRTGRIIVTEGMSPRDATMIDDANGQFMQIKMDLGGTEAGLPRKGPAMLVGTMVGEVFHVYQAEVTGFIVAADVTRQHGSSIVEEADLGAMAP